MESESAERQPVLAGFPTSCGQPTTTTGHSSAPRPVRPVSGAGALAVIARAFLSRGLLLRNRGLRPDRGSCEL